MNLNSRNTNIGLRHLRAALMVWEEQSFIRAASRLGVVPSALTETIRQLEEEAGVVLFDRRLRPIAATESGIEFLEEARAIVARFDLALDDLRRTGGLLRGRVTVGAAPSLVLNFLVPALAEFRRRHAGIDIVVHDDVAERIGALVLDRILDFGIAARWHATPALSYEPFAADRVGLVCHRAHPLAQAGQVRLADIDPAQIISLQPETGIAKLLAESGQVPPALLSGRLRAYSTISQLTLVSQGAGVALMPAFAASVIQSNALTVCPIADLDLTRQLFLITRSKATLSTAAARLLDHVRECRAASS